MRLLHLSDLHLRDAQEGTADKPERLSRKSRPLLSLLSHDLRELAPDAIVITGDLLDVPKPLLKRKITDPGLRRRMIEAAEADYCLIKDWLVATRVPFLVLPGNHDLLEPFSAVFADHAVEMDVGDVRLIAFHDWELEGNVPHRIGAQRSLFDRAMSDAQRQIHLQHYLVRPEVNEDYPYNYVDAGAIADAIEGSRKVIAVLAGHYHKGALLRHASGVHYSVVPAFCIVPHPYRVVDVSPTHEVTIREVCLEPEHRDVCSTRPQG